MNYYFYLFTKNEQTIIKLTTKGYEIFLLNGHKKGYAKISDTSFSLNEFLNNLNIAFPFEYSEDSSIFKIQQIGRFNTINDCLKFFSSNRSVYIK